MLTKDKDRLITERYRHILLAKDKFSSEDRDRHIYNTFYLLQLPLIFLNSVCLLNWQFSQFIFLTQMAIYFVMEQLYIIDKKTLDMFLHGHYGGLHIAIILQANGMLKSSFFVSFYITVFIYRVFFSNYRIQVRTHTDLFMESCLVVLRVALVIAASIWVKQFLSDFFDTHDDTHIVDILYSKFTNFKSFHTMLYTCSSVFDFLSIYVFYKLILTGLLQTVAFAIINILIYWVTNSITTSEIKKYMKELSKAENKNENAKEAENSDAKKASGKKDKHAKKGEKTKKKDGSDKNKATNEENKSGNEKNDKKKNGTDKNNDENKDARDKTKNESDKNDNANEETRDASDENRNTNVEGELNVENNENYDETDLECDKYVTYLRNANIDPGIFYNISQMFAFACMAIIIMRLKLLFTPHLCILSSLNMNGKYYSG